MNSLQLHYLLSVWVLQIRSIFSLDSSLFRIQNYLAIMLEIGSFYSPLSGTVLMWSQRRSVKVSTAVCIDDNESVYLLLQCNIYNQQVVDTQQKNYNFMLYCQ